MNVVRLSKRTISGNRTDGTEMKIKRYSLASARNEIPESDDDDATAATFKRQNFQEIHRKPREIGIFSIGIQGQ